MDCGHGGESRGGGTLGDRIDVYTQIVGTYCIARELSSVLSGDLDRWDVE